MTGPRCDVSPWLLPREREADDTQDGGDVCDDGIDSEDDCDGYEERRG